MAATWQAAAVVVASEPLLRGRSRRTQRRTPQQVCCCSERGSSGASTSDRAAATASELVTLSELQRAAARRTLKLECSSFGPYFEARLCLPDSKPVGKAAAWVAPFGALHIDYLKLDRNSLPKASRSFLGPGILLGLALCVFGYERGCNKAELLAIDDSEEIHARLVRFYRRLGFSVDRVVEGGRLRDIPDMLVWGGMGTLMTASVADLLERGHPVIQAQLRQ
eukprot:jgi/Chlat1/4297/Chrsp29S04382